MELIIWDWNGTLLNDVDLCVETMNSVLTKHGYSNQLSVEKYRNIFTFPVKDYYGKAGFDFERHSFDIVGLEFIEIYNKKVNDCSLQPNAIEVLRYFQSKKIKQIVISAREKNALIDDIRTFKIEQYFDFIEGISNNYAKGKTILFDDFFSKNNYDKNKVLLIGDTIHDYEIAKQFGLNFILFVKGHQDASHFNDDSIKTIENLSEIIQFVK